MIALLIPAFVVANAAVLALSIFLTLSRKIDTGLLGTLGLSMIGVAAAANVLKPAWSPCAVDGPESLMLYGTATVGVWVLREWFLGKKHGAH
ncbi:MAG: holin [Burkholderia gladioli]